MPKIKEFFNNPTPIKAISIIVLVGFAVFAGSLRNGFVADDSLQVVQNSFIHSFSHLGTLFRGGTFYVAGQPSLVGIYYRPLVLVFFTFIYNLFGQSAFVFHFAQLCLYIINPILVFFVLKQFINARASLVCSLLFLIHPMNAEAVFYVSNTQEILFMLFGLSALLLVQYKKVTYRLLPVLILLMLASLLSKETGIVLIVLMVIYVFLFKKKELPQTLTAAVLAPFIYILLRIGVGQIGLIKPGDVAPIAALPFVERIANVPSVIWYYFKTFFFPSGLATMQVWTIPSANISSFLLPLFYVILILVLLIFLGIYIYRNYQERLSSYLFFAAFLVLGLAFHSQVFPLDNTVADRWFYLPSIGLLAIVAFAFESFRFKQSAVVPLVLLFFVGFTFRTVVRAQDFHDSLSLATRDSQVTESYIQEKTLGALLLQNKENESAGYHLKKAADLYPVSWLNWSSLGTYYFTMGDMGNAEQAYSKACDLQSSISEPYVNLAGTLLAEHKYAETMNFTAQALRKFQNNPQLLLIESVASYKAGRTPVALSALQDSYKIFPSTQALYINDQIQKQQEIDDKYLLKSFLNLD